MRVEIGYPDQRDPERAKAMKPGTYLQAGAVTLSLMCLLAGQPAVSAFPQGASAHDQERLGPARRAGLRSDRTQIPALIAIVQEKPSPNRFVMETALHSLAQLGATDALPAIDALLENGRNADSDVATDPNVINAAKAARAHLVAEDAASPETNAVGQTQAKLTRFYSELGETPAELNEAILAYTNGPAKDIRPDSAPKYPVELYAMRELADMAYHSPQRDFVALAGVAQVDFQLDGRSALKIRLAPMSPTERLAWLVQDLSQKTKLSDDGYAEIQLAGDLGPEAGKAAVVKLQEMDQHRDVYTYTAFSALFGVVSISGDAEPAFWKHFEADADGRVAQYAQRRGAGEFIAGY